MTVFSLVASHHDLDLDTVARLSAGATGVGPALPGSGAAGAVVLATCNRVEIYAEADGAGVEAARAGLLSAVAASTSLPDEDVHAAFRTLDADATARHLFEVGAGLDSAVVGERVGGQVLDTDTIDNLVSVPHTTGSELAASLNAHMADYELDLLEHQHATGLTPGGDGFTVHLTDGNLRSRAVILATGAAPRHLGVPGEEELSGRGVSTCATCDGFFFKDHNIAVIGGGDSAMEEATFLTKFADSVTIVNRSENFRASKIMLERAQANEKIKWETNKVVEEVIEADGKVGGLKLKDVTNGETSTLDVTAMFVAIGHDPRSSFLNDQVKLNDNGYVVVEQPTTKTSQPGVFACGDLVDDHYQQAITAAGSGCRAAIDAEHFLAESR